MKKCFSILFASVALFFSVASCSDSEPIEGGQQITQTVMLYDIVGESINKANAYRATDISLTTGDGITEVVKELSVGLVRPAEADMSISVRLDEQEAKDYLKAKKLAMELLPAQVLELPKEILLGKGAMMSDKAKIKVNITDDIKEGVPYIFAIALGKVEGNADVKLSQVNKSLVYTLKKSPQGKIEVTKALQLERSKYLKFVSAPFSGQKTYQNFTIETLVCVDKFRNSASDPGEAGITTLFGIEGGMLFRFGDATVPANQLQAYGQTINFEFQEGRWYHVAIVFDDTAMMVYIDGKEMAKVPGKRPYMSQFGKDPFYIGRSWSEGRGMQGKLAEMRIWEVARTVDELVEGMYGVDPATTGLMGYWKMDQAEAHKIKNVAKATGLDLDFGQFHQVLQNPQPADIVTLNKPIEIEL